VSLTPVQISNRFKKQLHKKPPDMQDTIAEAVTQLRKDHRHPGLRTHRVWGQPGVFEARLDRGNRLTFHWEGETIVLRAHCNHEVLKRP
jgi:hypothetical protein